ncbi:hypothetical protein G4L39_05890 [Limisphaera ngatamarikiensis]|uniref:Uncharacterized protein n=1 Tax=Limisphaera ngatamarikiensis TaxID=1324935 RepID=A0A6M1RH28_9BACT|nr:hypothetical protein [Limisphaera ngatamarikiensis]NGO38926.1 hypothetical protein [Limisphaera ngatamarikiensis]
MKRICSGVSNRSVHPGWQVAALVALLCFVVAGVVPLWKPVRTRVFYRYCNNKLNGALEAYYQRPFNDVTNILAECIRFVRAYEKPLSRFFDVNAVLFDKHIKYAYMLLHSGGEDAALYHLNEAYKYHARSRARSGGMPVPRSDFVDFVIRGIEWVDGHYNVAWKSEVVLCSNIVSRVTARFATEE